ncbi:hypothetical protein BJY19_001677 [Arthrobacter cupressi]|nr:hypothetical protein [Arthrobacter cupressi]
MLGRTGGIGQPPPEAAAHSFSGSGAVIPKEFEYSVPCAGENAGTYYSGAPERHMPILQASHFVANGCVAGPPTS